MTPARDLDVHIIPIDQITVVNSRSRGQSKFRQILTNIANIGLKKPIIVTRRPPKDGKPRYDLVCGQGRLESYVGLGQTEIPALVVEVSKEDLLLMSLAENLARRQRTSLETAREILALKERGYKTAEIAKKVDLDPTYVIGMIRLLKRGEERLLVAVEHHDIPISTAVAISESSDEEIRQAMSEAYQKGELRGRALLAARRLIDRRRNMGKTCHHMGKKPERVSANSLLKAYNKETQRRELLMSRAKFCEMRWRFVVSAFRKLLADEGFINLLRAESLATMPQCLADEIQGQEAKREPQG